MSLSQKSLLNSVQSSVNGKHDVRGRYTAETCPSFIFLVCWQQLLFKIYRNKIVQMSHKHDLKSGLFFISVGRAQCFMPPEIV